MKTRLATTTAETYVGPGSAGGRPEPQPVWTIFEVRDEQGREAELLLPSAVWVLNPGQPQSK